MISQNEADILIGLPKKANGDESYKFPYPGNLLTIPIISVDEKEKFVLDINRGSIRLSKCTYQERYQEYIILARLDIDGPPHNNPDVENVPLLLLDNYNGEVIKCPHMHLYVEGYMDKWAIPISDDEFPNTKSLFSTLQDFFRYCNVINPPKIWSETLDEL